MEKKLIRENIIKKRDLLDADTKKIYDIKIKEFLVNFNLYNLSNSVFIFVGFGNEVDTMNLIKDALEKNKRVYVPKIDNKNKEMKVIRIKSIGELKPGFWGILEPESNEELDEELDLIIMPGVAFTRSGERVGYGGGYYDKFLEKANPKIPKVVLAFSLQVLEELPQESFDIKVNYIITENEIIDCKTL
ncbi:5-formyltetrahydrofolate cyclo-ligase [Clostridium paridis]|uniref:5-formyltetrahydrofolate cyclo-ligase n=1 Tax=Clostridium paridis TaxID=2803863 RepID=A0A937FJF3_9CLOT|nr:5-formyltetrahydrofolate cyclo-ligase [Clostridium paridis]MBL4933427.1 5-formyltetrahydrofolate cyclo-ligase [Clostridium paridis]